ncbi:MAG: hypothetical protein ACM3X6_13485 [Patescibacteria group bacterium]
MPAPEPKPESTQLTFVGAGRQGSVYRLDAGRCIKYYARRKFLRRELAALQQAGGDPLLPRVLAFGDDFIIREYLEGTPLDRYLSLEGRGLTQALAVKLLRVYETLVRLGYRRADLRLAHVILTPAGDLRVIDPTNMMKEDRRFPKKLLHDLARLGGLEVFMAVLARHRPDLLQSWRKRLSYAPGGETAPEMGA